MRTNAVTGAVTLIQRFGSALNLNVHFHLLVLDGVYRRYHGVFAPASPDRSRIVPGTRTAASEVRGEVSVSDRQRAMSWAQRLKRVFAIDIETCRQCGGKLRVIASIEEPAVIKRILEHLGHTAEPIDPAHPSRAPPQGDRLV